MKLTIVAMFLVATAIMAQTTTTQATTPAPAAVPPVIGPSMLIAEGVQWQRGAAYPLVNQTTFAVQLKGTSWYSYTSVATPFARSVAGAPPITSSLSTGGAYVAAQNASGSVSLVTILQAGFATTNTATAAVFTGNVGVALKPWKNRSIQIFPYCAGQSATGGSLASFVLQPGISIMYGFGTAK